MQYIYPEVVQAFGNKVRIRVCGILIEQNCILLVNHRGLNQSNQFWSPPGGGIQFGEPAVVCLKREFKEETGLTVEVQEFLGIHEYISHTLHAVELFFRVKKTGGTLLTGADPELTGQIIQEVKFMSLTDVQQYQAAEIHQLLAGCKNLIDICDFQNKFVTTSS